MKHRTTIFRDAEGGAAGGAQGAAAAGGGAPAAGSGAPAGDLAGFLGGINPDVRSLIETKGWHKDAASPAQVLERVASGYGALEKTVGLDKIALPPVDKDGKRDWSKWDGAKALGRPDDPAGYSVFKAADGVQFTPEQKAMHGEVGKLLHQAGVADWQARIIGEGLAKMQGGVEAQSAEAVAAETEATETALRAKWGQAYDSKIHAADLALSKAPPELAAKIVKAGLGRDPAFLEMFAGYGEKMGEDPTPGNLGANGGSGAKANTPQQAQAEIQRILGDPAQTAILGNREHPEYRAYNDRMQRLYAEAYPEPNQ